jgi:hypothetical protein
MTRHFVSYPKSGRTWIRYVLTQLGLEETIHFHHDGFEFNDGAKPPHSFDLSERLERYAPVDKLVYLERDPRDVIVSLYFQVTGRFRDFFRYQGTISEFIRDEYFGADNLRRFRDMWSEICSQRQFLKISYEACHEDMSMVVRAMLDYYEVEISSRNVSWAVANAKFDAMKQLEQSEKFPYPWLRPRQGSLKVREGKIGGFRGALSEEDIRYLDGVFFLR